MMYERRREVMNLANEQGLTVKGEAVTVSGARHDFATVSLRNGPFAGWSAEYSWETIHRATVRGTL